MRLEKRPVFAEKISHEKQFDFNEQVRDKVESAVAALELPSPAVEKARTLLKEGEKLIDARQKNITRDTHCANDLAPRTSAFALVFPKYTFYVPNPCILGTRPVLPCKNGSCCKLELVGTGIE